MISEISSRGVGDPAKYGLYIGMCRCEGYGLS